MVDLNKKIYVAGHTGLVGSAILRRLKKDGYKNIITATRKKLNLTKQTDVLNFLKKKNQILFLLLLLKLGEFYLIQKVKLISSQKTYKFKQI